MRGPYGLRCDWEGWREFLTLLSLSGAFEQDECIEHMGVSAEASWSSPDLNPVMYHRDIGEFVRDFKRIRAGYHTPGLYYGAYSGTWEPIRKPQALDVHQKRRLEYYGILGGYDPTGDRSRLAEFVLSLEEGEVEQAWEAGVGIDADDIDLVLSHADPEIKFERFGNGGLLYAEPSTALYPAYIALWEHVKATVLS